MRDPFPALFLLLLAGALPGQTSRNVQFLGSLSPASPGSDYNDVWGYVDPATGKEYCLLGSEDGTHVIDCSNPAAPVQRGLIATETPFSFLNIWRDIKTVGSYAYIVSEAHGGMQIVDLTNPDNPTKLSLWGATLWNNAHNIAADVDAGLVIVCGTDTGSHIIDVGTNPTNPTRLYHLTSPYTHDLAAQDGYGYFATGSNNELRIYDMTQLPGALPLVGSAKIGAGSYGHAAWPTRDNNVCVYTNEDQGGPVTIWDISNKRLPLKIATYTAGPSRAIPHNPTVRDRVAYISYYTEGLRVLDLSDAANPVEVGYYDTFSGSAGNYENVWGVYHGQPSGAMYLNDMASGLHIVKPTASMPRYGDATTGSAGATQEIFAHGAAYLGNSRFALGADGAPPSRAGVLALGAARASLTVSGVTFNVALGAPTVLLSTASDAGGNASVPLPVPTTASLVGVPLDAQFVFVDSAASFDLSATRGLEFEAFVK